MLRGFIILKLTVIYTLEKSSDYISVRIPEVQGIIYLLKDSNDII
nr:MAG TPA: hypothetical protein [Caudoviricetes sp.]